LGCDADPKLDEAADGLAIRRLIGAAPREQNDEWSVLRTRYMPRDTLSDVLAEQPPTVLPARSN
jgi:hypothetical protein